MPKIVVDQARQQSLDSIRTAEPDLQDQQQSLRLPDRFANPANGAKGMPQRRNSTVIVPTTLGALPTRRASMTPQQTASPALSMSSSEETHMSSPNILARRATLMSIRRMSLTADMLGSDTSAAHQNTTDILTLDDTEDDVFTQYYAIDTTMNDMTSPDAKKIVHKFEHNAWSGSYTHIHTSG